MSHFSSRSCVKHTHTYIYIHIHTYRRLLSQLMFALSSVNTHILLKNSPLTSTISLTSLSASSFSSLSWAVPIGLSLLRKPLSQNKEVSVKLRSTYSHWTSIHHNCQRVQSGQHWLIFILTQVSAQYKWILNKLFTVRRQSKNPKMMIIWDQCLCPTATPTLCAALPASGL